MNAAGVFAQDDPALPGHFPDHPVVPGVLLLDAVIAAAQKMLPADRLVGGVERVKFLRPLAPAEPFAIEARLMGEGMLEFACTVGAQTVATGRLRVQPVGAT